MHRPTSIVFVFVFCLMLLTPDWTPLSSSSLVQAYKVKDTTDPSFECSGCARTRLIGCFAGKCSYRCYRSCTNGTNIVIEAHRFVLEGPINQSIHRRKRRWLGAEV